MLMVCPIIVYFHGGMYIFFVTAHIMMVASPVYGSPASRREVCA
jgi:hypothetical protein